MPGSPAAADGLSLPSHVAVYHATVKLIPVRATVTLERQGEDLVVYRSVIEPRGWASFVSKKLTETSLVSVGEDGELTPLSYRMQDGLSDSQSDIRFDPVAGRVTVRHDGEEQVSDWDGSVVDLMTLRLVLSNDLVNDRLAEEYRVVEDDGDLEVLDVRVTGEETVETPAGSFEACVLEYAERGKDRVYRLWMVPDQAGLMVRLDQYEEGKLRGRLSLVEYRPTQR
jgi:hypothetical protein